MGQNDESGSSRQGGGREEHANRAPILSKAGVYTWPIIAEQAPLLQSISSKDKVNSAELNKGVMRILIQGTQKSHQKPSAAQAVVWIGIAENHILTARNPAGSLRCWKTQ